ncbi:MAG: GNAT family N-acetyltransferase [Phycisphaerales bacterium]|nr:GNAT family N-acetyltransferase [Phycisphaerales bacterium]
MSSFERRSSPLPVHLRPITTADLPELFRFQSDPDGARMAAVIPRDSQSFLSHWEKILADPSIIARAITLDSVLVGQISCFSMDGLDSVGYWIASEHWGRGIATRALALLLHEVRKRPLHARAARHNVASIRVLQRCGFVLTGYQHSPATERFLECEEAVLVLSE